MEHTADRYKDPSKNRMRREIAVNLGSLEGIPYHAFALLVTSIHLKQDNIN